MDGTFLNQGNRQFGNISQNGLTAGYGDVVVLGDFNRDGNLDAAFVVPLSEQFVYVAYGEGDGTFYLQSTLATSQAFGFGNVVILVAGDFNGDGWGGLVVSLVFGTHVLVLTNDGHGEFQNSYFATGLSAEGIFKADFNMDGKPDALILPGTPTSVVGILFGQ